MYTELSEDEEEEEEEEMSFDEVCVCVFSQFWSNGARFVV